MIIEIIKEIIEKIINFINKNAKAILSIIYLALVIISIIYCNDDNRMDFLKALIIIFIAFSMLCIFDTEIKKKKKQKHIPKQRYTKKNENGDIYVEENKLNQAIILLSILEDDLYVK